MLHLAQMQTLVLLHLAQMQTLVLLHLAQMQTLVLLHLAQMQTLVLLQHFAQMQTLVLLHFARTQTLVLLHFARTLNVTAQAERYVTMCGTKRAGVVGDVAGGLANAEAGGLVVDDPGTDDRTHAVVFAEVGVRLMDATVVSVGSAGFYGHVAGDDENVVPFASMQRLSDEVAAEGSSRRG